MFAGVNSYSGTVQNDTSIARHRVCKLFIRINVHCMLVREAGCFRQVAALYSDHCRQVPLYIKCLDQGRLAALDRWLHYTVTTIGRSTVHQKFGPGEAGCFRQVAALYSDHYRLVRLL